MKAEQSEETIPRELTLRAENIGGIDETSVTLHRGVTALTGRNATNRTSLLQAIMAALGSDRVSLKADAAAGTAELEIGDETYRRELTRRNGTVVTEGDPYLADSELADLFAFLLESNEARRAVARDDDLRELIMRPVDTEAIQAEIQQHEQRKRDVDERLDELDELEAELPDLERKRSRLTGDIEDLEAELATVEERIEDTDADVEETREEKAALEDKLDELQSTRSELDRIRRRIETERESIDALESEREDLEDRLDALPDGSDDEIATLEGEIGALEDEKEALTAEINQLQNTIQFNEQLLEDPDAYVEHVEERDAEERDVTDQLLPDDETVVCWTCGSSVPQEQIETTIDQLREVREERLRERNEVSAELRELRQRVDDIEDTRQEDRRLRSRLESTEAEIEERSERLEELADEREALTDAVSELESDVEELESDAYTDVLEHHKEANQLQFRIERKEEEREDVEARIEEIEERLEEREEIEERREEITDRLTDLRTRIDRIEADAVEAFNDHMENVLDVLGYDNLDRIWISRSEREVREGRRKVSKTAFELKIVRSTADGAAYEDSIEHLSESEREVTGLVFALAGYLVHDVYEEVPFMLLDSLEAIDSDRIAALIDYFESYAPCLVVALLHEDAQALETPHETVTEI